MDPDTVNTTISNRTAKIALITAAMESSTLSLSKKKLWTKTEQQFIVKYSVQGAYTYALIVLSTSLLQRSSSSSHCKFYQTKELSSSVRETVYWVKQAFDSEQAYPVDPNFVFSTEDTTLFVFEGSTGDGEECEWNLIDKTNDWSVRSDFEVWNDAENSAGLRVRLSYTMLATGLMSPLYIDVSGLTEEELSPNICPGAILRQKVKRLCKGGDDIHNDGFGWLGSGFTSGDCCESCFEGRGNDTCITHHRWNRRSN